MVAGTTLAKVPVMVKTVCATLVAALLLSTAVAHADDAVPPVAVPTPANGYRGQVIAADALAYGQIVTSMITEGPNGADTVLSDIARTGGIGTFLLGAPIVHVAHGNYGRAGASLGIRVLLPLVGASVGASLATCKPDDWFCGINEATTGMFVGALAASVVDVAFMSGATNEPTTERPRPATGLTLAPQVVATPNLAMLGLGGRF
jgi:hypothetical protein